MNKKEAKTGRNRNKLTTNKQVVDTALTLWECSEHISQMLMRTNMQSYFRDRLARLNQRIIKEAIGVGNDLSSPNEKAFETIHSTKLIARQLGVMP